MSGTATVHRLPLPDGAVCVLTVHRSPTRLTMACHAAEAWTLCTRLMSHYS